ncbi:MAG TPA: exosortase-associated EpsI family protein [Methanomicrobia archaeon]|nr:exosortase-associated EpsI family protein [Methanomicrobia archaeon]
MVTGKEPATAGDFFEDYAKIIGLLMLAFVIIMLCSTPSTILAKRVTMIGTELSYASSYELPVRTKLDLGNTAHLQAFPRQIGEWSGYDYDTARLMEQLGADVMLMRAYSHPQLYQPIFLLIMQSYNRSSFHPPIVCYPALGYTIESASNEIVTISNASWVEDPWFSAPAARRNETILPVKKLVVTKQAADTGRVTERRVVLYFYVKEPPLSSDTITMVRVEALAPTGSSYDGILTVSREFMAEIIPCMFEVQRPEQSLFWSLAKGSNARRLMLVLLFLAPLAVIFYPELRARLPRRSSRT